MPRVHKRVARKDYPKDGIAKGDTYYYTKIKLQRGGIVKRSKTPFMPSQLTQSAFKSGWLAAEEAWSASDKGADDLTAAAEAIRDLGTEAQDSFDNMPEGLQQGDTGQTLENRANECESAADSLDELASQMQESDDNEPGESDFSERPEDADEGVDDDDLDLVNTDGLTYDEAIAAWQEDRDNLQSEADDILSSMPD